MDGDRPRETVLLPIEEGWSAKRKLRLLMMAVPACLSAAVVFVVLMVSLTPFSVRSMAIANKHAINEPIYIELSQGIADGFKPTISPAVKGEWRYERSALGVHALSFVPGYFGLTPNTTYTVRLTKMKRLTGQALPDQEFKFTTEAAPGTASVKPAQNAKNVPADTTFTVRLTGPNRGMRSLRLELAPKATVNAQKSTDDVTFNWKPRGLLKQGQTYELKLFDTRLTPKKLLQSYKFTTAKEPKIVDRTGGLLYPNRPVDVTFGMPMKKTGAAVKCTCVGSGGWKDESTYRFHPKGLKVATNYTFTVVKGIRAKDGGITAKDYAFQIATPGAVKATIAPLGTSAALNAAIKVTFNQDVNRREAEKRFSLSPKAKGKFIWQNDKSMIFQPTKLAQQKNYTVTLARGVTPETFGKPSSKTFKMKFVTKAVTTKLKVPVHAQQHPSSCEAAALRMALAFYGTKDIDANIVRKMGYNGKYKQGNEWDDPNKMYVGNIDGKQSLYQGYGAYGAPIAKAARAYGRGAEVKYGATPRYVAGQILKGYPVIIIGTVGHMSPQHVTWQGPNGTVHAWMGMHARTVVGVVGTAENPKGFWVNDPYRGTHEYWTPKKLASDLAAISEVPDQVVVVR